MREDTDSGWSLVAQHDGATELLGALVDLEPGEAYSRSELAERSGVPMKTLYLADTLETFADAGLLARVDDPEDDSEAAYVLPADSDALEAARAFEEAVAAELGAIEAD